MRTLTRTVFSVLALALVLHASPLFASDVDLTKVNTSYSLTGTGFGSADRITDPGQVYLVHIDGLLARAIADHITPTNSIVNGKLVPPAKGFRGAFGAMGDVKQVQPGQRFYLHAIELQRDALVFTMLSLDSVQVVSDNGSSRSRVRMYLRFPLSKDQVGSLTPEAVHSLTDPIFSPEMTAAASATVHAGESDSEVRQALGAPDKTVDLGSKKILVYKDLKITLVDGKVVDAQ